MTTSRPGVTRDAPVRTVAVHCPDWPVAAAGARPHELAAVFHANRVVAATDAARAEGVVPGLRRREAQRRCPGLVVHGHDPARDAREFEAVAAALGTLTPRVEVTRPGTCSFASRGPSRYHGGDEALVERAEAVARGALAGRAVVRVGLADGPFAALLAAVGSTDERPTTTVPPGDSPAFLAPMPAAVLGEWAAGSGGAGVGGDDEIVELVGVLARLGLHTLGAFAALPAGQVMGRFGPVGVAAHRLAGGLDPRPLSTRPIRPDLTVAAELDPPAERVDRVAFAAKALADELLGRLHHDGLACARLVVVAETEHSERLERCWQADTGFGQMGAAALADRVRWQLDGWLSGPPAVRPTSGITRLVLVPEELVVAGSRQPGFWGGTAGAGERVVRAVARVSGLVGPEAVCVPELGGGRDPERQIHLVPAVAVELREQRAAATAAYRLPWPGRVPSPTPAVIADSTRRETVEVCDGAGREVTVDGRGQLSAPPAGVRVGRRPQPVTAWAGPWPADERWWDPEHHRRRARLQLVTGNGAYLVAREQGSWWLEATYA